MAGAPLNHCSDGPRRAGHVGFHALLLLHLMTALSLCLPLYASAEETPAADRPTIRTITVEIGDVFDGPNLGTVYQTVNKLKISTREEVIRRELLFTEGEPFDEFLIEESKRNLRTLPFLRRVSITPLPDGDYVDILVSVSDTWTLFPQFGFSSGGGTNKTSIGLVESNVLGYGKRFEVFYADEDGRQTTEGVWEDNRLFGTYQRLLLGHFERSDGFRNLISYGRPFRSLTERQSWGMTSEVFDLVGRLFENGDERFIFRQRRFALNGGYTVARGDPEVLLKRYTLGYEYISDEFVSADAEDFDDVNVDPASVSHDPNLLAADRRFSGPFVRLQQIEPDFVSINYVDRFERVEDFNLGNTLNAQLGLAADALGSKEDTMLLTVSDADGFRMSPTAFMRAGASATGRATTDDIRNSLLRGELKYYDIFGAQYLSGMYVGKHTLASSLTVDIGEDLDRDREFLLGANDGLRAYKDRTFSGNHRLLLNIEDRYHLVEDVLRLVSIGGVFFFDAGGTSDQGLGNLIHKNIYADFGVGLRFGFPRSSGGTVLRFDLGFPLRDSPDGDDTMFQPRFLITIGQNFGARLSSESFGVTQAATNSGL